MELVYLWVEDYKNIKKQGFNFSPRFRCEYNEKENKLTIEKNDDYIPDFFGENINVTAIVGKNGSGKSSVLEYLSDSPQFVVTFENSEFQVSEDIEVVNKTKYLYIQKNINLEYEHIVSSDYILNNLLNVLNEKKKIKNHLNYILKFDSDELFILGTLKQNFRQLDTFLNSKNFLNEIVFSKNIILEFDYDMSYFSENIPIKKLFENMNINRDNLFNFIYLSAYEMMLILNYEYKKEELSNLVFSHILNKYANFLSLKDLFLDFKYQLKDDVLLQNYNKIKEFCSLFDNYSDIYSDDAFCTWVTDDSKAFSIPLNRFNSKILEYKNKDNYPNHVYIDNWKWGIKYSSGETIFINLISTIFYIIKENSNLRYIYIDEGESFLHPNWQKKYISYIVQFIKDNFPNRKIHIILTSHSPFLLSDIPKQNIIFLDKDERGNCKVVDGLKEKKQTFGANIHTLLSDSFFMEDGLMGEFAKSKINDVINYLHDRESKIKSDDEAQKLIHIIGEPIVKNQLQRMLDSRRLKKVDRIDAIEESIKALQAELTRLKP